MSRKKISKFSGLAGPFLLAAPLLAFFSAPTRADSVSLSARLRAESKLDVQFSADGSQLLTTVTLPNGTRHDMAWDALHKRKIAAPSLFKPAGDSHLYEDLSKREGILSSARSGNGAVAVFVEKKDWRNLIRVNPKTGQILHVSTVTAHEIHELTRNGKNLLVGITIGKTCSIDTFDSQTEALMKQTSVPGPSLAHALSDDGRLFASASSESVDVYETETGRSVFHAKIDKKARSLQFSADGSCLLFYGVNVPDNSRGKVISWSLAERKLNPEIELMSNPEGIYFGKDRDTVFILYKSATSEIRNLKTGQLIRTIGFPGSDDFFKAGYAFNGKQVFDVPKADRAKLKSLTQKAVQTLWLNPGYASESFQFSPDRKYLSVSEWEEKDWNLYHYLNVWNLSTSSPTLLAREAFVGPKKSIYSNDSAKLATISDGGAQTFDLSASTETAYFEFNSGMETAQWLGNELILVRQSEADPISIWDLAAGSETLRLHGSSEGLPSLSYSGETLARSYSNGVIAFNTRTGEILGSALTQQPIFVVGERAVFTFDGSYRTGTFSVWQVSKRSGQLRLAATTPRCEATLSTDQSTLALRNPENEISLWDVNSGRKLADLRPFDEIKEAATQAKQTKYESGFEFMRAAIASVRIAEKARTYEDLPSGSAKDLEAKIADLKKAQKIYREAGDSLTKFETSGDDKIQRAARDLKSAFSNLDHHHNYAVDGYADYLERTGLEATRSKLEQHLRESDGMWNSLADNLLWNLTSTISMVTNENRNGKIILSAQERKRLAQDARTLKSAPGARFASRLTQALSSY